MFDLSSRWLRRALAATTHVGVRVLFVAVMIAVLTVAYATDYAWTGPIFIATQFVLVALVRYAWEAYDKWAAEHVAWLRVDDVEAWAAWQRQYVAWATTRPTAMAA